MSTEILKEIQEVQSSLDRETITRHFFQEGNIDYDKLVNSLEREKLFIALEILSHPEFLKLIDEGKITLGAIKPKTEISKLNVASDVEGEKKILEEIKPPLELIFSLSLAISRKDIENFYPEDVRKKLESIKEGDITALESLTRLLTSGPITYFILFDKTANAINEWRRQIGATNPKNASPDSIRGKYALGVPGNLVHGSDSKESVIKEIEWLTGKIHSIV